MTTPDRLDDCAGKLVEAARAFHAAAGRPVAHAAAPDALSSLEEALQVLSGACYQLAADASPEILSRRAQRGSEAAAVWRKRDGLSREQEVRLMGALHDVGAAFARCARECRAGRATVAPLVALTRTDTPAWGQVAPRRAPLARASAAAQVGC
jgi:hypothetical protein